MRILYCWLLYLSVPFILLRLLWRSRKAPDYRKRWSERFAYFKLPENYKSGIWVHVVSVGEVLAAIPLINELAKRYPDRKLIVTTMTPTGSERIRAHANKSIFHIYIPYDLPGAVNRFLNKVQPELAIFMETELWPNILHQCYKRKIPTMLANARLSAKSMQGYARFQPLVRQMINKLIVIAAQAEADANRFIQLGARKDQFKITGNIKFDMQIPASLFESAEILRQQLGGNNRPIWIAASTHDGEDEIILKAFKIVRRSIPDCLLILVPRHPERFNRVANLCHRENLKVCRRSQNAPCTQDVNVFLGDSMGELRLFYGASDIAFVGGSLITRGGHNMLEAAAFGLPVISGPHTFNFMEVTRLLTEANALIIVKDYKELAEALLKLLTNPDAKQQVGERGKGVVNNNRGALKQHLTLINQLLQAPVETKTKKESATEVSV